nr:hypothetical protein [Tanacetum cinerariifolium]
MVWIKYGMRPRQWKAMVKGFEALTEQTQQAQHPVSIPLIRFFELPPRWDTTRVGYLRVLTSDRRFNPLKSCFSQRIFQMKYFRGMTYEKVRPIFEREYNKVQTLFKLDKYVEEPQKKSVTEETLLQESFKKLKAVEVTGSESTQDTPTNYPKEKSEEDV